MSTFKLINYSRSSSCRFVLTSGILKPQKSVTNNCHKINCKFYVTIQQQQSQKSPASNLKLLAIGCGIGLTVGTAYSTYNHWTDSKKSNKEFKSEGPFIIDALPANLKITRKVVNPKGSNELDLILFQYQTCPFCCKVRAFFDAKGLTYSIVEVDAVLRQSIKWSPYKKVPLLLARTKDGKYIQLTDSSMIISILSSYLVDPQNARIEDLIKYYPKVNFADDDGKMKSDIVNKYFLMFQDNSLPSGVTKENLEDERKWRTWVDSHLVHLISPNVYRTRDEAFETFEWFSDVGEWEVHFPQWERNLMVYVGALAMWAISKRLKKRHGLSDDVRSHLYKACDLWMDDLTNKKQKFNGGKQPNLADLAVFGALNSMEGCQAFADCLNNTNIGTWFYLMKDYVNRNKGTVVSEVDHQFI